MRSVRKDIGNNTQSRNSLKVWVKFAGRSTFFTLHFLTRKCSFREAVNQTTCRSIWEIDLRLKVQILQGLIHEISPLCSLSNSKSQKLNLRWKTPWRKAETNSW